MKLNIHKRGLTVTAIKVNRNRPADLQTVIKSQYLVGKVNISKINSNTNSFSLSNDIKDTNV